MYQVYATPSAAEVRVIMRRLIKRDKSVLLFCARALAELNEDSILTKLATAARWWMDELAGGEQSQIGLNPNLFGYEVSMTEPALLRIYFDDGRGERVKEMEFILPKDASGKDILKVGLEKHVAVLNNRIGELEGHSEMSINKLLWAHKAILLHLDSLRRDLPPTLHRLFVQEFQDSNQAVPPFGNVGALADLYTHLTSSPAAAKSLIGANPHEPAAAGHNFVPFHDPALVARAQETGNQALKILNDSLGENASPNDSPSTPA